MTTMDQIHHIRELFILTGLYYDLLYSYIQMFSKTFISNVSAFSI